MLNKKAQIFSFELVFITLVMCIVALGIYAIQTGNLQTSIISPTTILQERNEHQILGMIERDLLLNSSIELDWESDTFEKQVENAFFELLKKRPETVNIIWNNISDNLIDSTPEAFDTIGEKASYLRNNVYSFSYNNDILTLTRTLEKKYNLEAMNPTKISFATTAIIQFNNEVSLAAGEITPYKDYLANPKITDLSEATLKQFYQLGNLPGIEENPTYPFETFTIEGTEDTDYKWDDGSLIILNGKEGLLNLKVREDFEEYMKFEITVGKFNYFLSNEEGTDIGNGDLIRDHAGVIDDSRVLKTILWGSGEFRLTNKDIEIPKFYVSTKTGGSVAEIEENPKKITLELIETNLDRTSIEGYIILGTNFLDILIQNP
jgi:hypothetical protein